MELIERKYLAHFLDANFNSDPDSPGTTGLNYVRLGEDLEQFADELNPQVEIRKNILGEQKVVHNGYETQSAADTFYAYTDEPLWEKLATIANERLHGTDCMTSRIDALFSLGSNGALVCEWAYRELCWVVPQSLGGDTSGVQIPFNIYDAGSRVAGTMALTGTPAAWTFTATT